MQIRNLGAIAFAGSILLSSVASADTGRRSLSSTQSIGSRGAQQSVASIEGATGKDALRTAATPPVSGAGSVAAGGTCTAPGANCQLGDLNDADNSDRTSFLVAEGFSPAAAGNVVDLCWRGAYDDGVGDCQGLAPDTFEVTYYASVNGAPDSVIGSFSQAMGTLTVTGPVATGNLVAGFAPEYEFSATHAAVAVAPGQCYWVEISNAVDTAGSPGCVWFWERGAGGDLRGYQDGPSVDGYGIEDLNTFDHALCLSVPLAPPGACYPAPPANDNCADSVAISDGTTFFDTTSATTDGLAEPGCFIPGGGDQANQDIWFDYTASCTGDLQVSLCDSLYDTNLAIYDGATCPMGPGTLACGDDECGPNTLQTQVTVVGVTFGQALKIRVGGSRNFITPGLDIGPGSITVSCGGPGCTDACAPGAGDCFASNGSGGCDDSACCTTVCALDDFCCCTTWDSVCANLAVGNCGGAGGVCATATGDCCQDLGTPGCGDSACCLAVCAADAFCCGTTWDAVCAGEAATICDPLCNVCPDGVITWLDPADGFLDARQPTDIGDAALLLGVSEISVSGPVGADALECWSLCETTQNVALHPPGSGANAVVGVAGDGIGGYTLTLAHPLTPGEITKLSYSSTSGTTLSTATLRALPADVNGDGTSSPADILAVIDSLNGVTPLPASQTDTDRSNLAGPEDILRVIDLLNGASAFEPWLDASVIDGGLCP